jgi:hypothetical protein
MPALPNVPKAIRISLDGLIQGTKPWRNSFHYGYSVGAAVSAAEVLALANAIATGWAANIGPALSDTLELASVTATALDSSTAPEATVNPGTAGSVTTQPVAAGTALVMQRKVARRYRGGHSRVYIPGVAAAELDDTEESWDSAFLTAFQANWIEFEDTGVDSLEAGGHTDAQSVNISYYEGFTNFLYPSGRYHVRPTLRVTPLVDAVTDFGINPRPCSQRRRQQP